MARPIAALQHLLPFALGSLIGCASLNLWQAVHAADATPGIVLTQPADGATVAGTVSLWAAASDVGFAGVRFLVNGVDIGSEITSGNCTKNWNTSGMADGSYALTALARTDAGDTARSPDVTVTVANAAPQIFDVKAWNISGSAASITWYTLQPADAQLDFGTTPHYGSQTALDPTAATIHTQVLTGLSGGTTYHFRVYSRNAIGRLSASPDLVFVTDGASATPPMILNPAASVTATTATLTWITDQAADSQVNYGRTSHLGILTPIDTTLVTSHSVVVTGLAPGKTYSYRVLSRTAQQRQAASAALTFTTASK
jgi:hypothetical protein